MKRVTPSEAGCDCATCPFSKDGKPDRPVLAVGPSRPLGVVVAESPGSEEVDRGEPLVGNTGREFDAVLESAGLPRERLVLLNALCCRPAHSRKEGEMHKAIACCRPYVAAVLDQLPDETPMLIAGKWAYLSITGRSKGHDNERGFLQRDIRASTARRTLVHLQSPGEVRPDSGVGQDEDDE